MSGCATLQDDRVDRDLMTLNQRATRSLLEFISKISVEMVGGQPVRYEEMWLTYLAAEIYGNADAMLILMTRLISDLVFRQNKELGDPTGLRTAWAACRSYRR